MCQKCLLQSAVVFTCMPMFVSIDSHSEKRIIPHILSSNMPTFVSVCIAEKGTGNGEWRKTVILCKLSVVFVSIDLHSSKPYFSIEFVDTYSIHSFPPPSRYTQQIHPSFKVVLVCCNIIKHHKALNRFVLYVIMFSP